MAVRAAREFQWPWRAMGNSLDLTHVRQLIFSNFFFLRKLNKAVLLITCEPIFEFSLLHFMWQSCLFKIFFMRGIVPFISGSPLWVKWYRWKPLANWVLSLCCMVSRYLLSVFLTMTAMTAPSALCEKTRCMKKWCLVLGRILCSRSPCFPPPLGLLLSPETVLSLWSLEPLRFVSHL